MGANRAIVILGLEGNIEGLLDPRTRRIDVATLELDAANRRQGHCEIRKVAKPRKFRRRFVQVLTRGVEVSLYALRRISDAEEPSSDQRLFTRLTRQLAESLGGEK